MQLSLRLFPALLSVLLLSACTGGKNVEIERQQYVMGTRARVFLPVGDRVSADVAIEKINELDRLLSDYRDDSQISKINRNAGIRGVNVDPQVAQVLRRSLQIARETDGAFDPTIGAVTIDLYGFGRKDRGIPDKKEIKEARSLVNYRKLIINDKNVYLAEKGMKIDLGGIGKGFAVDRAVDVLKERGVVKGLVALSGDMRFYGFDNKVGIQHPDGDGLIATFNTNDSDIAISTSGDYRRYIREGDRTVHHLIVPSRGSPGNDFSSITVLTSGDATKADAYATALFVMGKERALEFIKNRNDIGVFFVYNDGEIHINDYFKKNVHNLKY